VKTSYLFLLIFIIISGIGFGLITSAEEEIMPTMMKNTALWYDSSNYFEFTSSDILKFVFAQSDENAMNQTDSENIVELNATSPIIEEEIANATKLENVTVGDTITIVDEVEEIEEEEIANATKLENVTVGNVITIVDKVEEEQNWVLILIVIVIAAIIAGIAVVLSRKKKITTPTKGTAIKKFCRKCGSSLDPKSKFCGKCGVSINPVKS